MTTTLKNDIWKAVQSIGVGVIIFLLTGILAYQKKTYDWQIEMSNRMNNEEKTNALQDGLIGKRQQYEMDNDKEVHSLKDNQIFLFAHFNIPYQN